MNDTIPIIQLPFNGEWSSINSPGHDKYAFDFVAVSNSDKNNYSKKSLSHNLFIGSNVEDWYGWSKPIYSPVKGKVIEVSDGWPDKKTVHISKSIIKMILKRPKIKEDIRPFAGNYVIIKSEQYYLFIAHMRCGSIKISNGQEISSGQIIGEVGNSGYSLVPHIHFQVMDSSDVLNANILPFKVTKFEKYQDNSWSLHKNEVISKSILIRSQEMQNVSQLS